MGQKSAQNRRKNQRKKSALVTARLNVELMLVNVNFMATITTEFGKVSSKKQRAVYLRVRDKKTEKRILTGIKVDESEISPKTKRIKNFEKAQAVEKLKVEMLFKLNSIAPEINNSVNMDASTIASSIVTKKKTETLDFFSFAEDWISKNSLKSTRTTSVP